MKKVLSALLCAVLVFSSLCALTGCGGAKEKVYDTEHFAITLTDRFEKKRVSGCYVGFSSPDMGIAVIRQTYAEVGDDSLSYEEYADEFIRANGLDARTYADGQIRFDYEKGGKYHLCIVKKDVGAYWIFEFVTDGADRTEECLAYGASVKFFPRAGQ